MFEGYSDSSLSMDGCVVVGLLQEGVRVEEVSGTGEFRVKVLMMWQVVVVIG